MCLMRNNAPSDVSDRMIDAANAPDEREVCEMENEELRPLLDEYFVEMERAVLLTQMKRTLKHMKEVYAEMRARDMV